ncbi:DUF5309 family protein [Mitsuokella multacida]|uniref:SU10 major capsid protein n=1 Tax=Mitsuokella multacida TaxID=52226 RepID=UPI0039F5981E
MANNPIVNTSTSQSVTYEAEGEKEDFSPIITNIDPDHNFFLREFPTEEDATQLNFNWLTESLKPPKVNAHLEMEDYKTDKVGSLDRLNNTVQFFQTTGRVSDAQRKTAKQYNQQDEFPRQKELAFKQMARDMEYAIAMNTVSRLESGMTPAKTGGVPFFLQEEKLKVTFDSTANTATTSEAHKLNTGDFVYFIAPDKAALPKNLVANREYYVRKKSDTTFDLFYSLDEALAADSSEATSADTGKVIALGTAGSGDLFLLKNNVVDGAGTAFTEDNINDVMEMCYKRGGDPTVAVMSAANKRRFSAVITGQASKRRDQKDKSVTNITDTYISDFGTITAQVHRQYSNDRIDLLDMNYWGIKYFVRPHEVTGLSKKGTYEEFVLEASFGVKGTQPKASGSIVNLPA